MRLPVSLSCEQISIHALREEGDLAGIDTAVHFILFLSTPSARRATPRWFHPGGIRGNFYPRPPRGGRPTSFARRCHRKEISIHALREEGDCKLRHGNLGQIISIHALREEGDQE